jgi:hypothetical protein
MTKHQTAAIITSALREAAKDCECNPAEALNPVQSNKAALAARNIAIRLAHDQGVDTSDLAFAFTRSVQTIRNALAMSRAT